MDIKATIVLLLSFNLIFRKVSKAPSAGYKEVLDAPTYSCRQSRVFLRPGKIPSLDERCPEV